MVSSGTITGLVIDESSKLSQCEACIQAKFTRKPFPHARSNPAEKASDLTHTDLWGPAPRASLGASLLCLVYG